MAAEEHISISDDVFRGETVPLRFVAEDRDLSGVPLRFIVKRFRHSETALINKSTEAESPAPITVDGDWHEDPEQNQQVITVTLDRADTYDPDASPPVLMDPGCYRYALVDETAGAEAVLFEGQFHLRRSVAW